MRRSVSFIAPALIALLVPTAAQASQDSCSIAQGILASKGLQSPTNLTGIYNISRMFPGCSEDGGVGEEISDHVVVQLSHHWRKSINELAKHHANRAFVSFVLHHIDATTDSDDLHTILAKAKTACPVRGTQFAAESEPRPHRRLKNRDDLASVSLRSSVAAARWCAAVAHSAG